jgi:hypothetical protein
VIVARPRSPRVSLALRKTLFRAQNLFTAASSLLGSTLILVGVNKVGGPSKTKTPFDRKAYQREYMRAYMRKKRAAKAYD